MDASSAAPPATHQHALPRIGSLFEGQGGIFAGIVRGSHGQPDYALIVPTTPPEIRGTWGEYGKKIAGADDKRDGQANTAALVEADSDIANKVVALEIDGHKDWYMASLGEAQICHANVPELFNQDDYHWTSTQDSPGHAWVQGFEGGFSGFYGKDYERRAVAVRRLAL